MTVRELIERLQKIENKQKRVAFDVNMKEYIGTVVEGSSEVYITNLTAVHWGDILND